MVPFLQKKEITYSLKIQICLVSVKKQIDYLNLKYQKITQLSCINKRIYFLLELKKKSKTIFYCSQNWLPFNSYIFSAILVKPKHKFLSSRINGNQIEKCPKINIH